MSMGNAQLAMGDMGSNRNEEQLNNNNILQFNVCENNNNSGGEQSLYHSNEARALDPVNEIDAQNNEHHVVDIENMFDIPADPNNIEMLDSSSPQEMNDRSDNTSDREQREDARPPPLQLESDNAEVPSLRLSQSEDTENVLSRMQSSDMNSCGGRGAHVDVSVFRYQPGVQAQVENVQTYRINLKGAALTGNLVNESSRSSNRNSVDMVTAYEMLKGGTIERHQIRDHRAKQLLIVPTDDKFVAVAAPEAFSRHSGTCVILGGQGTFSSHPNKSYELKVGSFLRIGSVGVVVSEINTGPGGIHKSLTWEELACLKGDIEAIQRDFVQLEAMTAKEERSLDSSYEVGDRKMCYICFDDVDEPDNPLVAPCNCKGDTRYLHLNCLQKWHNTTSENKVCVVLNSKGVRVCSICMSSYKSTVRLASGEVINLLPSPLPPPYICFMVVTKHLNNEDLFSTKYQLSFSSVLSRNGNNSTRVLIVGRSRQCDMVLDYRTVSTRHASIKYSNGGFFYTDLSSSNGSYLYLREPLLLPYGENVHLKWGSNVVSLKAKRSLRHRLNTLVNRRVPRNGTPVGSMDMSVLETLCEMGKNAQEPAAKPGDGEDAANC